MAAGHCGRPARGKAFCTVQLSVTPACPIITSLTGCKRRGNGSKLKEAVFLSFFFISFYKVQGIKIIPQSTGMMEFCRVKMKTSLL